MLRRTIQQRGLATVSPLVIKNARIQASVILSRAPQITRDATPFEKAYFDYREKLEREESAATPTEFYFKKGSVAERRWKDEEKARQEVMANTTESLTDAVKESQATWEKENASLVATTRIEQQPRETEADRKNDTKSLERSLQKTLYLIVKKNDQVNPWQFPQGPVDNAEYLHEAAERTLKQECGVDMDTWFVGRQPIGVFKQASTKNAEGSKTFFMKARVFAGQVKPSKDVVDFAWLTKQELANTLSPEYYKAVRDSLGDL
ncbi:39S mitochondrial ribosomal protein L46-domain-containing protein [Gilbertella persicaria]|uniref:39S mitochondrial ribosomal protein L46-domain-containing protein n=1 Tax=Gilbertella persicaria TaxID=101096 RepID=UPI00222124A8|nr:39S mitochondrial ribosomal protein L46-domain-containing protein [Gilbertella persicaria]KAI8083408.1 39S mitochondrial ribosomal protein L46-domain-containing protein [Gilbertella persicaria]